MTRNEKLLCAVYAMLAVTSLYATWSHNIAFMIQPENRTISSWVDAAYVNHAAASLTNDLLFLAVAACIFIVVEGRRLQIQYIWVYILLSFLIAISFTFPLFLIARQVKLVQQRKTHLADSV